MPEIYLYAAEYFLRPYKDSNYLSTISRTINGNKYVVYRPNHGLAHSLRQGFLARDIILLISKDQYHPYHSWVIDKLAKDHNFERKIAIISSFQRSGRESEISSSENPELYAKYERNDCNNFIDAFSGSFIRRWNFGDTINININTNINTINTNNINAKNEVIRWSKALLWDYNNDDKDVKYISEIIRAAHMLDLRRIPSFDKIRIIDNVANYLNINYDSNMCRILWEQSGKYLHVSGDRDMIGNKTSWSNRFFTLQNDPAKLYFALRRQLINN